jgi:glutamate N-acetyltransferase / amino-acid N-acetyltransferase
MSKDKELHVPAGYLFASAEAGLRKHGAGPDLALMYSTVPAQAAAVFTTNRVQAAPVLLSKQRIRKSPVAQAILVNAGNANCATGPEGMAAARATTNVASGLLNIPLNSTLVASTGVIGVPFDARLVTDQLPSMVRQLHPEGCVGVSHAILTTDTVPKMASRSLRIRGKSVKLLGMCKGSGMIYPRMATMLGFFFTDAAVEPGYLKRATKRMADLTFNRISIDGDTSTNDTLFLLANGMAGNRPLREGHPESQEFFAMLVDLAQELAIALVRDGEGATKVAEIRVEGSRTEKQAEAIARAVALSPLVKTAIAGADPNWGRIICAAGYAGVELNPANVDIYLNRLQVCKSGGAAAFDEAAASRLLTARDIVIRIVIGDGKAAVRFWTCDFTNEYIRINSSYRT